MKNFTTSCRYLLFFFFFNDTATTEIYTLSLHDALPISFQFGRVSDGRTSTSSSRTRAGIRSEEHTSELQSHHDIVCRLLLEKKKTRKWMYSATWSAASILRISASTTTPSIPYWPVNFFFNDTATTKIYTLSLHDALPICGMGRRMSLPSTCGMMPSFDSSSALRMG